MIIFSSSGNPEWYTITKREWKRRPKAFHSQEIIYISNNKETENKSIKIFFSLGLLQGQENSYKLSALLLGNGEHSSSSAPQMRKENWDWIPSVCWETCNIKEEKMDQVMSPTSQSGEPFLKKFIYF